MKQAQCPPCNGNGNCSQGRSCPARVDFAALRAQRNAAHAKMVEEVAKEMKLPADELYTSFNPEACYCACGSGGPCEHKWDGEWWTSEDGCASSATCSRCGVTAMSHDARVMP